jgi:hypothetical protein
MSFGSNFSSFSPVVPFAPPKGITAQNINIISQDWTSYTGTNYLSVGVVTQTAGIITIIEGSIWQVM